MKKLATTQRFVAAAAAAVLIAGCGGAQPAGQMLPMGATASSHAPQVVAKRAALTFSIHVPAKRAGRAPRFISPSTQGLSLKLTGAETRTVAFGVTPSSSYCYGGRLRPHMKGLSCTFTVGLIPGKYVVTIDTFDKAPVGGTIPVSAHLLSTAVNVPLTMVGGIANSLSVSLDGVPAELLIQPLPTGTVGTEFPVPQSIFFSAKDADGNYILGTYTTPIKISNSDTSGATSLKVTGYDNPPANTLLSSGDQVIFNYNGASINQAVIGATATGVAKGASATFAPFFPVSPATGLIGTSTNVTITGAGFVQGQTTVAVAGGGVTVNEVKVASPTSLTARFFTDAEAAVTTQMVTVTTGQNSNTGQFTISNANTSVVTLATDGNDGKYGYGAGTQGDLRYAIANAPANAVIVFDTTAMCAAATCTIDLAAPLPLIRQAMTIDGGKSGRIAIDGQSATRAFWVQSGDVTLQNLTIQNVVAKGGDGGGGSGPGGGGGPGLGGGVLLTGTGAFVSVVNDTFFTCSAVGGKGGAGTTAGGGGGGGGLGGNGGAGDSNGDGGGGGGALAPGIDGTGTSGGNGTGGGGGGGGGKSAATGGLGSPNLFNAQYSAGQAGSAFSEGGAGGSAGMGGGGGGGGTIEAHTSPGVGGNGNFGGGGGTGGAEGYSAGGGVGLLGGGGGAGPIPGNGATLTNGVIGGNADTVNGGGGAAAGSAIFVITGALTTSNSSASGCSATGGLAGGGSATAGTADQTPVFNYGGSVNGVSTSGPYPPALMSPTARRHARLVKRTRPMHR